MIDIIQEQVSLLGSEHLADRGVLDWASPVPVFGDHKNATIATMGINPSNLEFQDQDGDELDGQERRFHTLHSLGLDSWCDISPEHHEEIEEMCRLYFHNRPYTRWFNQLDYLIAETGYSYYNYHEKACHLDLVPYATRNKWALLKSIDTRYLKSLTKHSLRKLIDESSVEMVILNGQQVVNEYKDIFQNGLRSRNRQPWNLSRRNGKHVLGIAYTGKYQAANGRTIKIVGFNHNIQSSYGMTKAVRESMRRWITLQWSEIKK